MKKYKIYKYWDTYNGRIVAECSTKEEAENIAAELRNNEKSIYTTYSIEVEDIPEPESLKKGDIIWDIGNGNFRVFELIATAEDNTLEARKKAGRENITMCESTMLNLEDNNTYAGSLNGFHNMGNTHPNICKILKEHVNQDTRPLTPGILTEAGWRLYQETDTVANLEREVDGVCLYLDFRKSLKKLDIQAEGLINARLDPITVGEFNTLLDIVGLKKFKV